MKSDTPYIQHDMRSKILRPLGQSLVVLVILLVIGRIVLPAFQVCRDSRMGCMNNLKSIMLALHYYHEVHGALPPAFVTDANGTPLHSWRVLILPYLNKEYLPTDDIRRVYAEYRFDEPWNGPHNRTLHKIQMPIYACPNTESARELGRTNYHVVIGADTAWPGSRSVTLAEIADGTSNTVFIVESSSSTVHWMEPKDLNWEELSFQINDVKAPSICSPHPGCVIVALGDGATRILSETVAADTMRALLTKDGNEDVGDVPY